MGKAAGEGKAYGTIANTVSPCPGPGNRVAACHSGLTDPRGELTLSHVTKAQSKHITSQQCHKTKNANRTRVAVAGLYPNRETLRSKVPQFQSEVGQGQPETLALNAGRAWEQRTATQWRHCLSGTGTSSRWACTTTPEVLKLCLEENTPGW